jgi:hypothetical protein
MYTIADNGTAGYAASDGVEARTELGAWAGFEYLCDADGGWLGPVR